MSLNHAIDHPLAVDSQALIDFFWLGQAVPPLPTQRPSILIFFLIPLLSFNVFSDLLFLHFNSKLSQTWQVFDFWSSALSQGMTACSQRGYRITKKLLIQSLASTASSIWDHLEGNWSYLCIAEVIKQDTDCSTGASVTL